MNDHETDDAQKPEDLSRSEGEPVGNEAVSQGLLPEIPDSSASEAEVAAVAPTGEAAPEAEGGVDDEDRPEPEAPVAAPQPSKRLRRSRDGLFTIGQVVEQLGPEFPDLTISKIRYLEDRGLVIPQRTAGGYRKFSAAEVHRLRTVLTLQRDEFLPLEVIRERLARGTASAVASPLAPTAALEAPGSLRRSEKLYPVPEALELAGIDEELFRQLGEYHLIERPPAGVIEPPPLSETDVEISRVCGLLARHGVEPRNLRLLRSSIERESALMEQLVAPALRSSHPERRAEGEQVLRNVGSLLSRLLDLLLYKELRRLVE